MIEQIYEFNEICLMLEELVAENPVLGLAAYYRFKHWMITNGGFGFKPDRPARKKRANRKLPGVVGNTNGPKGKPRKRKARNAKPGSGHPTVKTSKRGSR